MSSRFRSAFLPLVLALGCARGEAPPPRDTITSGMRASASGERVLRVCADPNSLPFSNDRREGFENKIADVLAAELGAKVEYTWWAQRRGFIRSTLKAGMCDVVMGIPTSFEMVLPTKPYYRSTYVFVTRSNRGPKVRSFDDAVLRTARVGVQMIGDDGANSPPAHALARRGIIRNVSGFMVTGDYREENPPARIIDAVANGDIDIAVAWGPLAGYFAGRETVALTIAPVTPQIDLPYLPFVFDISIGVRREDAALRDELDRALGTRRAEIDSILEAYHVPRVGRQPAPSRS